MSKRLSREDKAKAMRLYSVDPLLDLRSKRVEAKIKCRWLRKFSQLSLWARSLLQSLIKAQRVINIAAQVEWKATRINSKCSKFSSSTNQHHWTHRMAILKSNLLWSLTISHLNQCKCLPLPSQRISLLKRARSFRQSIMRLKDLQEGKKATLPNLRSRLAILWSTEIVIRNSLTLDTVSRVWNRVQL